MLESGLPVQKSLELAAASGKSRLRRGFLALAEAASRGETLAETMASHPGTFSPLDVLVVEAAETSGRMSETLERLSRYHDFRDRLRRTVTSGLVLPLVILHIAALVIPLPSFVLGRIGPTSYFLQVIRALAFFYVPACAILGIVRFTPDTGPLRALLDGFTLWVPILGRAVQQIALSRFSRTFQMLYACGSVPIAQCVRKAVELAGNTTIRRRLAGGIRSAEAGHPVSEGFSPRLPREFVEVWRIAEEAGKLDESAARLADAAAEDSQRLFELLAVWVPRVIYALVSIFIIINIFRGFFAYYGQVNDLLNAP